MAKAFPLRRRGRRERFKVDMDGSLRPRNTTFDGRESSGGNGEEEGKI